MKAQQTQENHGGKQQKITAQKAQGATAPKEPERAKPDAEAAEDAQEAKLHLGAAQIDSEANEGNAQGEDARHGYSQDSGYAQSGGQKPEQKPRARH